MALRVDRLVSLGDLHAAEEGWRALYAEDERATVFQSWAWQVGWFEGADEAPRVLVVRRGGSDLVALLSLSRRSRSRWGADRALRLAGMPLVGCGALLCRPGEDDALSLLAGRLRAARWRSLTLRFVTDPRLEALARSLARPGARVAVEEDDVAPQVTLPGSWEGYLEGLSARGRQKVRRRERQIHAAGLELEEVGPGAPADRTALAVAEFLGLHALRFGPIAAHHERVYRSVLARCAEEGVLHLQLLRDGARPVAVQVGFLDRPRGVYRGFQSGWDPAYAQLSPGIAILFEEARAAIRLGFGALDLGRGDHAYKAAFGGRPAGSRQIVVRRGSGR